MMLGMNEWNDCKPEDLLYIYIYICTYKKFSYIYSKIVYIYIYLNVHKNNKIREEDFK